MCCRAKDYENYTKVLFSVTQSVFYKAENTYYTGNRLFKDCIFENSCILWRSEVSIHLRAAVEIKKSHFGTFQLSPPANYQCFMTHITTLKRWFTFEKDLNLFIASQLLCSPCLYSHTIHFPSNLSAVSSFLGGDEHLTLAERTWQGTMQRAPNELSSGLFGFSLCQRVQ